MKTYYSIISFMNSHITLEKVSIGLIMFDNERIITRFSSQKISLAKKLAPESAGLLDYAVDSLKATYKTEKRHSILHDTINSDFLQYLSRYEQGILNFSAPNFYLEPFSEQLFTNCFTSWIGAKLAKGAPKLKTLKDTIAAKLISPLKDQIDTNYKVEAQAVKGLVSDYRLDTIGVNGSIYASNAFDITQHGFNGKLFEFESFLDVAIPFLETKFPQLKHKKENIILFIDQPKKNSEHEEKYQRLIERNNLSYLNNFKIEQLSKIDNYRSSVERSKAFKLSELLTA